MSRKLKELMALEDRFENLFLHRQGMIRNKWNHCIRTHNNQIRKAAKHELAVFMNFLQVRLRVSDRHLVPFALPADIHGQRLAKWLLVGPTLKSTGHSRMKKISGTPLQKQGEKLTCMMQLTRTEEHRAAMNIITAPRRGHSSIHVS